MTRAPRATEVTRALLRRMPLPPPDDDGDKDARGRVLAVGGSAQTPGAILLAGVAALRAGAGKLQLATVKRAAAALGVAVPEALVVGLTETHSGEIAGEAGARALGDRAALVDALLLGPGMMSARASRTMIRALIRKMGDDATLLLDAAAITSLRDEDDALLPLHGRVVITPHAGEMATLLGVDKRAVDDDPARCARTAAARFGAVVALKGAESWIAEPDGALFHYAGGSVGLATSGSGDTLAGIVTGLAARGASAAQAAVWGVYVHGAAGNLLARRMGRVGYLARELLDEVPRMIDRG
jgi:hydroxyethylthiazole kinase-like uncharacterized protein yjeF